MNYTVQCYGRYRLPNYAASNRPSNAYVGELIINTDTATLEMWTGDRWANCGGGNRGGSQSNPAFSGGAMHTNKIKHNLNIRNCMGSDSHGEVVHLNLRTMQLIVLVQVIMVG